MLSLEKSVCYPLFFTPLYKQAIWGGALLSTLGRDLPQYDIPIGESWEIVDRPDSQSYVSNGVFAGKTLRELIEEDPEGIVGRGHRADVPFPLLLKIIDADKDLSLQIHPNEESCKYLKGAEPKNEMWYVLDHRNGAEIMAGINEDVSEELFNSVIGQKAIKHFMKTYQSTKGNSFYIKAATMHAIGGGNLIYEIQQNSDTTYRVSDWGRQNLNGVSRELHLQEAQICLKNSQDSKPAKNVDTNSETSFKLNLESSLNVKNLVCSNYFKVDEFTLDGELSVNKPTESFETLFSIDNDLKIKCEGISYFLKRGSTCLIPARLKNYQIHSSTETSFIRARL